MQQATSMPVNVRDATIADLPAILAIYNDVIATSLAIYTEEPLTLADREAWFAQRMTRGFPVLVAVDAGGVAGLASYGDFRAWPPGYRHTVEHSVHVRADRRGAGVGKTLMRELLARAVAQRLHVMVGAIDAGNLGSIRFHEAFGFVQSGLLPQVGVKWGRWLDLVFMTRRLSD